MVDKADYCPIPKCGSIRGQRPFCQRHYGLLPKAIKDELHDTFSYRDAQRGEMSKEYASAVRKAKKWLTDKEKKRKQ